MPYATECNIDRKIHITTYTSCNAKFFNPLRVVTTTTLTTVILKKSLCNIWLRGAMWQTNGQLR